MGRSGVLRELGVRGPALRSNTELLITFSGTAFSPVDNAVGGIVLSVDGHDCGVSHLFFNKGNQHLAMPAQQVYVPSLPAGSHTVEIRVLASNVTRTDAFDFFPITVVETSMAL
jgi:hypothetical protein